MSLISSIFTNAFVNQLMDPGSEWEGFSKALGRGGRRLDVCQHKIPLYDALCFKCLCLCFPVCGSVTVCVFICVCVCVCV